MVNKQQEQVFYPDGGQLSWQMWNSKWTAWLGVNVLHTPIGYNIKAIVEMNSMSTNNTVVKLIHQQVKVLLAVLVSMQKHNLD